MHTRAPVLRLALRWALVAALAAALAAMTQPIAAGTAPPRTAPPGTAAPNVATKHAPTTMKISFMSQNIFYGGDDYNLRTGDFCAVPNGCPLALHHLAHVIRASGADVVGVQEAERDTAKLARLVGGWYASPRAHVISRFPIIDPPHSHGDYVFIEPVAGRVIAMANTHLPSTPYGPYKAQKGWSRQQVLHLERTLRVPAIEKTIHALRPLAARGIPVVLTGDFNSPSYLDWTPAAAHARALVPYSIQWPASKALAEAGFVDSYREVYPSPVKHPGFTWSPGGPETRPHDFPDRIDWVLHAGPAKAVSSEVVGEAGNPQVDLGFGPPYPTDHRGVVSTLRVKLAPAPDLVSPSTRRVVIGKPLHVRFHANSPTAKVVLVSRGRGGDHRIDSSTSTGRATDGTVMLNTRGLTRQKYSLVLLAPHGRILSMQPVWAYPRARATVTTKPTYRVGEPIQVRWSGAPGMSLDWISLFPCEHGKCADASGYLTYDYTHTRIAGKLRIGPYDANWEGSPWPLPAGTYIARLLVDDGYVVAGRSQRFRIVN